MGHDLGVCCDAYYGGNQFVFSFFIWGHYSYFYLSSHECCPVYKPSRFSPTP
ncbi:Uncharacterised protein [Acinetobacter baumannii]|nr:Uncharacterised protein [Acinetobacter baumannii]